MRARYLAATEESLRLFLTPHQPVRSGQPGALCALEIELNSGQILLFLAFVKWNAGNANALREAFPRFPPNFEPVSDLVRYQAMVERDFGKAEKLL